MIFKLFIIIFYINYLSGDSLSNRFCCSRDDINFTNLSIGLGGCDLTGFCKLSKSTICGFVNVKGYFLSDSVIFDYAVKVDTVGYNIKNLKNCTLKNDFVRLQYALKVAFFDSSVGHNIIVRSSNLFLSNTKVKKNILIFPENDSYMQYIIYLLNGSVVEHDIFFNKCDGIIYIDATSKIKGSVLGSDVKLVKHGKY